jgi:hypothetical protein
MMPLRTVPTEGVMLSGGFSSEVRGELDFMILPGLGGAIGFYMIA